MNVILEGGPADGMSITLPQGLSVYRHLLPGNIPSIDKWVSGPVWYMTQLRVADYRHTGLAYVNLEGDVMAVIYRFEGME